jgi:hypothetical protein
VMSCDVMWYVSMIQEQMIPMTLKGAQPTTCSMCRDVRLLYDVAVKEGHLSLWWLVHYHSVARNIRVNLTGRSPPGRNPHRRIVNIAAPRFSGDCLPCLSFLPQARLVEFIQDSPKKDQSFLLIIQSH